VGYQYRVNAGWKSTPRSGRKSSITPRSMMTPAIHTPRGPAWGRLFSAPFSLTDPLPFSSASPFVARDAISPATTGRRSLRTGPPRQTMRDTCPPRPAGETQTLFLAFALSTLQDSAVAIRLAANALDYLLDTTCEATSTEGISGSPRRPA